MSNMSYTGEFEEGYRGPQNIGFRHRHDGDVVHRREFGREFGGHGRHGRGGFGRGPLYRGHGPGDPLRFGGRARRGEMRYVLMDALRSGPKHGYEIVKALEERSAGQYVPSPGTVYPTMQYLQDEGFVIADQEGDRRVFRLTDAGKAELDAHAADVEGFWARFEAKGVAQASRHEVTFLEEELESLYRTIWGGLAGAIERGDQEMVRRVRQAVERCREDVRNVISGAA